ncbi:MAG: excinuclease ABC subunit UvrA, partial [Flavobacteriales bacterium]
MQTAEEHIEIIGAREHNLKNIDVTIPRNQLVVITGLSGSGKSSLAFDTIYAEGQRRYIETFGAYARQFIGEMERPDVDKINGLSPVISIEQKTVSRNPRSTVGTITEIYDFMRLLYARASDAYSYETGERMVRYTDDQIVQLIREEYANRKIVILAPLVKGRKGHYRELFESIMKQGYLRARIDGELVELTKGHKVDRYKIHDIELVVDRIALGPVATAKKGTAESDLLRLRQTIGTALKLGKGTIMVMPHDESATKSTSKKKSAEAVKHFSRHLMCPTTGISYSEPEPNLFSFNSPYGACPHCSGLGEVTEVDMEKIIPDPARSIKKGGIAPLGEGRNNWWFQQVEGVVKHFGYDLNTPISDIEEDVINVLLYGSEELFEVTTSGNNTYRIKYEGIIAQIEK